MAEAKEITIYDISGEKLITFTLSSQCERVEELMSSDYAQLQWESDECSEIPVGSYIEWKGERLILLDPYTPVQKSEIEWTYTPQFHSRIMKWGRVPFFYYATTESGGSQNPEWSFVGAPVRFMELVCRAIQKETGESWTYSVETDLAASASIEFNNVDINSGLNEIASSFETEWWADKVNNVLHLGKAQYSPNDRVELIVGENVNPPSVTENSEPYYEQFYIYGSTRNITQEYEGTSTNTLAQKRLTLDPAKYPDNLLPPTVPGKTYVGLRKRLIFDTVYPRSFLSISDVRMRLMYRIDGNGDKVVVGTTKDPESGNQIPVYDQYAIWGFKVNGFTLNPSTYDRVDNPGGMYLPGLNLSVHFRSGALAGREFELNYHEKESSADVGTDGIPWTWKAGEYEILFTEESGTVIPDMTALVPKDGDEITFFNIRMPQEYIKSAQDELYDVAIKEINERYTENRNNYECKSNAVVFEESNPGLTIGRAVTYRNGDFSLDTRVIKLVTKMDYDCEQTITIGNEKVKGNFDTIKEEVVAANKSVDVLALLNNLTNSLTNNFNRTQQAMLAGFDRISRMWQFDPENENSIYTTFNAYSLGDLSALGKGINGSGNTGAGGNIGGGSVGVNGMYYGDWTDYITDYDTFAVSGQSGKKLYDFVKDYKPGLDSSQLKPLTLTRNGITLDTYHPATASIIDIIVPTKISELTNDKEFVTQAELQKFNDLFEKVEISDGKFAIKAKYDLFSEFDIVALGSSVSSGSGSDGSGGGAYNRLDNWSSYNPNAGDVLSAKLGYGLKTDIDALKSGALLNLTTTGTGNAVTDVTKTGNSINVVKGDSFLKLSGGTLTGNLYFNNSNAGICNVNDWLVFKSQDGIDKVVITGDTLRRSTQTSPMNLGATDVRWDTLYANSIDLTGTLTASSYIATSAMTISKGLPSDLKTAARSKLYSNGLAMTSPGLYNDAGWVRMLGSTENDTVLEIAVGDDGNSAVASHEEIAVRAYTTSNTVAAEIKLFDKNYNQIFRGVTANSLTIGSVTLSYDATNNALKIDGNAYSTGDLVALGSGSLIIGGGTQGGGSAYDRLDAWGDYSSDKSGYVLSAALGYGLKTEIDSLKSGVPLGLSVTGSGNAITDISKSGNTITATKGSTFLTQQSLANYVTLNTAQTITANKETTAQILKAGSSESWISGRNKALVRLTSYNAYSAITSMKTTNGSWEMGVYTDNKMYFTYTPDSNYNSNSNSGYSQVCINNLAQVTAAAFVKSGGTAAQFLKADGSVDGNTYLTSHQALDHINSLGRINAVSNKTDIRAGLTMAEAYSNGYPCAYGNVIRVKGSVSSGSGELLLGWSGSNNAVEHIYYRNNRDAITTFSEWRTLAFTSDLTWGNITGKPTTLSGYGITDAYTKTEVNNSLSNYLPRSGGSMTNTNLVTNLNADLLDGVQGVDFMRAIAITDLNTVAGCRVFPYNPNTTNSQSHYGVVAQFSNNSTAAPASGVWLWQLNDDHSSGLLYRRSVNSASWTAWRAVAFTDSNVYSATRLQGTYSLWGQNFYGNNVSGNMTGVGNIGTSASPAGTIYVNNWLRTTGSTGWYSETYGGGWYMSDSTWIRTYGSKNVYCGSQIIRTDGQIQIGDSGSKFKADSSGNVYMSGGLTLAANNTICGNGGNLYIGNSGNQAYVYIQEDMQSSDSGAWSISKSGVASFSSLSTGSLSLTGNLSVGGTSTLSGAVTVNSTLDATGLIGAANGISVQNGAYVWGGLYAYNGASISGNMTVSGNGNFNTLNTINGATIGGPLNANLTLTVGSTISASGNIKTTTDMECRDVYLDNAFATNSLCCYDSSLGGIFITKGTNDLYTRIHINNSPQTLNVNNAWLDIRKNDKSTRFFYSIVSDGDITALSDMRRKNVIRSFTLGLRDIASAPLFIHTWKDGRVEGEFVGTSAQYWQRVLPQAVRGDDELSMAYGKAAMAAAISLARSLSDTGDELGRLKQEVSELQARIIALEALVNN